MLRWDSPLSSNTTAAVNTEGFVYGQGDIPDGWDLDAAADWSVSVHHSWVKGFHRVQSVDRSNRTIIFTNPAKVR